MLRKSMKLLQIATRSSIAILLCLSAGAVLAASWPGASQPEPLPQGNEILHEDPIAMAKSGNNLAVAWASRGSPPTIILSQLAWGEWVSEPVVDTQRPGEQVWSPTVGYEGSKLVAAWVRGADPTDDDGKQTLMQYDSGDAAPRVLMDNIYSFSGTAPHLVVGQTGTHLAFAAAGSPDEHLHTNLYYAFRPTGQSWRAPEIVVTSAGVLNPGESGEASHPKIALDGNTVHIVWQQHRRRFELEDGAVKIVESYEIWHIAGTLDGDQVTWGKAQPVSPVTQQYAVLPDIVRDTSGTVHVVWTQLVGAGVVVPDEQHIYYQILGNPSTRTRLNDAPVYVNKLFPNWAGAGMSTHDTMLCVTWHGYTGAAQGTDYEEISLRCSTDLGATWKPLIGVSDTEKQGSIFPAVALGDGRHVHVAWVEYETPHTLSGLALLSDPVPLGVYYRDGTLAEHVYLPLAMRQR